MAATAEQLRLSQVGMVARSPEGHAAKGMAIKGQEDLWVEIQANTFRNWVNEHLRGAGAPEVRDLAGDLRDGTRLCALVEALQRRPIRPPWIRRPANQHQFLENVAAALAAIAADGVKLVNIGNVDIVNGNLKLVLGLIWSLIVRYQIGRSKFPPRKLMLAWLKAVLPECRVANFTTDWNSGVFLSALLDYCRPGLMPHWRDLDPRDSVANCRRAMELARRELGVPVVLQPEYLASPHLDELSGMTYLSYFMREGGPGYNATLRWVQSQLPDMHVRNFTRDWNDGTVLCSLVRSLGGPVPGYEQLQAEPGHWESNLNKGLQGGRRLGVEPLLRAKDMADTHVEHLGVMAYAAHFQWLPARRAPGQRLALAADGHTARVHKPFHFRLELLSQDVDAREVRAEVVSPSGRVSECRVTLGGGGGKGSFIPTEVGMHQVTVFNEGEAVRNCPLHVRAVPELSSISFPGMEPCAVGSIVEVLINSNGANTREVDVTAQAPSGRALACPVREQGGVYSAAFQPDEPGEWRIAVTHGGQHIQGGPFTCFVFDPNGVKLRGLDKCVAAAGQPVTLTLDTTGTGGLGDVVLDVVAGGRSVPHRSDALGAGLYRVSFTPAHGGKHRIYTYFNGQDVKGSPAVLRVSGPRGPREKSSSPTVRRNTTPSPSPLHHSTSASPLHHSASASPSPLLQETSWRERTTASHSGGGLYISGGGSSSSSPGFASPARLRSSPAEETPWRRRPAPASAQLHLHSVEERTRSPPPSAPHVKVTPPTPQVTANTSSYFSDELRSSSALEQRMSRVHMEDSRASPRLANGRAHSPLHARAHSPLHMRSPAASPLPHFPSRAAASPAHSPSPQLNGLGARRGSLDLLEESSRVDTSSNVRVSAMLGGLNSRADSWDAIAKTRNLLSYGSLESLANLASRPDDSANTSGAGFSRLQESSSSSHHQTTSTTTVNHHSSHMNHSNHMNHLSEDVDAAHPRFTSASPQPFSSARTGSLLNLSGARGSPLGVVNALVTGDALKLVPVNRQASFDIELPDGSLDPHDVTVTITAPSRRAVPAHVFVRGGRLCAQFTVTEVGEHAVDVRVRDARVAGAPFRTHAYDARAIVVGRIPDGFVGRPVEFEIDGRGAGSGNLEILVNGGHVTSFVRSLGGQRFLASFVPHDALVHLVDMKFNGEPVPGSPWEVQVMSDGVTSAAASAAVAAAAAGAGAGAGPGAAAAGAPGGGGAGTGAAGRLAVRGDAVRLVAANSAASFEISAPGARRQDVDVHVISPSRRPVASRVSEEKAGEFRVSFTPTEVGAHLVEVAVGGRKLPAGPLVAKVYNAALIRVTDVASGVVAQPCQFRVDASQAGEGQLEISINEGEVPNHVQVVGGGRCLVSFTPEAAKPHLIDIKFNGETVTGCPFVCAVSDTNRVSLTLRNLELVPVNEVARFHMAVDGSGSAELAVSVHGPANAELPVKVTGNIHSGFTAEFTPRVVGAHSITVEYNGHPVSGTPFIAKAYDSSKVLVGPLPRGSVGKTLQFMVDASQAGEGNLEITISARGHNIPTQVHPQGNARFAVSFVPVEPCDHVIAINFNKESVPGSPFLARVQGDSPHQVLVSGPSLTAAAVGKTSFFTVSNVAGSVEDIEVNVEGPGGQAVPAQVKETGAPHAFQVEFTPRVAGEHRVMLAYRQVPVAGSPFSCKVYDVSAIRVTGATHGLVSKPVTFLVETREAGPGNLEVTVNGGRVPTSAQAQGPHTYAISFTPREAVLHTVDLRFNGEDVPGSPFECIVSEAARVVPGGEGLEKVSVGRPASFTVEADTSLGKPEVSVLGPARRSLATDIVAQAPGRYSVSFNPADVGDHSIEVKLGGSHVEGSPFLVKAYDASKVKVTDINSGVMGKPIFFSINASQAGAGNLEIIVSVGGRNVPNYVQAEGNAKFRVNFKPQEAAPHSLSVRFNGEPVPGSPFTCRVLPGSQALVSGSALKMAPAGRLAQLLIDPQAPAGGSDTTDGGSGSSSSSNSSTACSVVVTSPSGLTTPARVTRNRDGKFCAEFTPSEVGRYSMAVSLDGEQVKGSPFACNVYDVEKVKITGLGSAKVGKPATFTVDASEAGEGTLELVVSTERTTVKAEVVACARGLYDVTFVPHEATSHFVNISFNEEDVPGSPFQCEVIELSGKRPHPREPRVVSVRGDGLKDVAVGTTAIMDIDPRGLEGRLNMEVTGPTGARVPCAVRRLPSGLWRAEYRPVSVGPHSVAVLQDGQAVSKTPYTVHVYDPQLAQIVELEDAYCHRAATFKVDSSAAGRGILTVSVRAAGQEVKNTIRDVREGLHQVIFHPKLAVPHRVDVKLNGMHIAGCPMEVPVRNLAAGQDVMATGLGLYQSRAGCATSFVIETLGLPSKDFDVLITGPQGAAVPVRCYQQKDGNLLAEFTASNAGTYKIEVSQGARAVRGSPYYCQVYDASKVKLADISSQTVSVNDKIVFKVLRKDAGFAELDVTVRSPLGQDLPLEIKNYADDPDTDLLEFCPSVAGDYRFCITYGGDEVPGSPLTFTVEDLGIAKASGDGLICGQVDCPATFKIVGTGLMGKPSTQVDGPDSTATCTIEEEGDGVFSVSYTPREVGVFDVQVCWDGSPVPGSPFHPKVVDPRKVRVIGGWEAFTDSEGRLELALHQTKKISLELGEAGPGQLTAECRGPAGDAVPVAVEAAGGSRARLLLTPRAAGEHLLYLQFGGFPLPRSPILAIADGPGAGSGASAQPVRVVLTGRGLAGAKAHEEADFTIDGSQAGPGLPEVTLTGMKADIRVNLQHLGGNVYRATYTPVVPGAYLLNVMWSDRQVKGCPLKVAVTAIADASRVICSGDGLRVGTVGKEIRSFIDTRRAGPGELTAHCVGPHKVAYCELYEHGDGTFTLNVKPQEAGRHALTIKYGGEHVTGSPFALRVSGAPDPSKVRVYGPGVEHGVLATFQSRFICDTRGAGAGQLTVRIRGPKGAFRVEMQRESQKDRTILCKYDPTEPGDYRVEVKWAGELVPGSPFMVMIFDTQEELNRFLQGSHSPGSELYGSVGYSTGYAHMNFGGAQPSWRGSQAQL